MRPLRVLIAEDNLDDATLEELELRKAGYEVESTVVDTEPALRDALRANDWQLVISDGLMPRLDAHRALDLVRRSRQPQVPFIVVSGSLGEEAAVDLIRAGANDFVNKANLSRLQTVVARVLEAKRLRDERDEALQALRMAVQVRDDFLSVAAHELRTPTTALRLQVQALARAFKTGAGLADVEQRVSMLDKSSLRLAGLIDRLLDISRIASGKVALERTRFDLVGVVRELVKQLAEALAASGSTIDVDGPEHVDVVADRHRIEAVVSNLLSNAVKYGRGRPVQLRVEDHGDGVVLTVADQGIGIAAPDQARIFERFERAVSSRHYGGFGLGLWLSREIVEAHGGTISVESGSGAGATFRVTLPKGG